MQKHRKKIAHTFLVAALFAFIFAAAHPFITHASTPSEVLYLGKLTNAAGAAVTNGTYQIKFAIYNADNEDGDCLWSAGVVLGSDTGCASSAATRKSISVAVVDGFFSVKLGAASDADEHDAQAFPVNIFDTTFANLYLGVTVCGTGSTQLTTCTGNESEMTPRKPITSAPFAFRSQYAEQSTGNFGIGAAIPSYNLSFGGDAARTIGMERRTVTGAGKNLTVLAGTPKLSESNTAGGDLFLSGGKSTGNGTSNIYFQTAGGGTSGTSDTTPVTRVAIDGAGKVGIGALGSAYLSIAPTITASAADSAYSQLIGGQLNGGSLNSPMTAWYGLYINPSIGLSGGSSNTLTNAYGIYTELKNTAGTITNWYGNYIAAPNGSGTRDNIYALVTAPSSGNVGIGTIAPTALFSVGSTSQFQVDTSGNVTATSFTGSYSGNATTATTATNATNIATTAVSNDASYFPLFAGSSTNGNQAPSLATGLTFNPSTSILEVPGSIASKGISWTSRTSAADNSWYSITYGNGLFVALANDGGATHVMTSPDGTTWTMRTTPGNNNWTSITYGNGLFVAVGITAGVGNQVMTSPDGITWTSRTSAADNSWAAITYGNGLFVAVSYTGSGNRVMTSPDGITWTIGVAASKTWTSVTYGNGIFVAVGSTAGTGNQVMTSTDGLAWSLGTSAADNSWRSVTYGNGTFVAVSSDGSSRVMTSADGLAWASKSAATADYWYAVTYGNGLFVAVAQSGTNNRVMTSPDGTTWKSRTTTVDNTWRGVVYGNGIFVAVSSDGSSNRVMTSGKAEFNDIPSNKTGSGGSLVFSSSPSITTPSFVTSATTPLIIGGTTTTSPLALRSTSGVGTTGADIIFQTGTNGGTEAMRILNSSFVGIGVSPSYKLDVLSNAAGTYVASIKNTDNSAGQKVLLLNTGIDNTSRTTSTRFIDFAGGNGAGGTAVRGAITGNGDAVAYSTSAQDLAEYFMSAENPLPQPGDVVALDTSTPIAVHKADSSVQKQDRRVIGVVSTQAGFVGGAPVCNVDNKDCDKNFEKYNVLVGMSGRVPVKVSNENGSIAIGDFLTVSSVPGVAMKATRAGTTIGIALENYSGSGTGKVVMFINLSRAWGDRDPSIKNQQSSGTTSTPPPDPTTPTPVSSSPSGIVTLGAPSFVSGRAELTDALKEITVTLPSNFATAVGGNYQAFITSTTTPAALFISSQTNTSFTVRSMDGMSFGPFNWMALAGTTVASTTQQDITPDAATGFENIPITPGALESPNGPLSGVLDSAPVQTANDLIPPIAAASFAGFVISGGVMVRSAGRKKGIRGYLKSFLALPSVLTRHSAQGFSRMASPDETGIIDHSYTRFARWHFAAQVLLLVGVNLLLVRAILGIALKALA